MKQIFHIVDAFCAPKRAFTCRKWTHLKESTTCRYDEYRLMTAIAATDGPRKGHFVYEHPQVDRQTGDGPHS